MSVSTKMMSSPMKRCGRRMVRALGYPCRHLLMCSTNELEPGRQGAGREHRYRAKLEAHDGWILVVIEIVCFIERIALC